VNNNINESLITPNSGDIDVDTSKSTITFQSFTYRRAEPELWFTKEHIHDNGAVRYKAYDLIPFAISIWGY